MGVSFESQKISTKDGEQIALWYIPSETEKNTGRVHSVLLFCHGNAGNISHRVESIRQFLQLGLSVCIFDYRGYGQSTGKTTENGTYTDAETVWQYLVEQRGVSPNQIIIFVLKYFISIKTTGTDNDRS